MRTCMELVHIACPLATTVCGLPGCKTCAHLQQCICAEHGACPLQGKEDIGRPSQPPRQSLVGRRMAADVAQRTLDAADSIIFSGHKRHDRSNKKPKSPLLSPGQVRSVVVCCTSQLCAAPVSSVQKLGPSINSTLSIKDKGRMLSCPCDSHRADSRTSCIAVRLHHMQ